MICTTAISRDISNVCSMLSPHGLQQRMDNNAGIHALATVVSGICDVRAVFHGDVGGVVAGGVTRAARRETPLCLLETARTSTSRGGLLRDAGALPSAL